MLLFPEFKHCTIAIHENELIFRKYIFKYLGVKEYDVCNIFSKRSGKYYVYNIEGEGMIKQMWQNANNW